MEVVNLPDYEAMYKQLFNAVTDAIKALQAGQIAAEEIYISSKDLVLIVLPHTEKEKGPSPHGLDLSVSVRTVPSINDVQQTRGSRGQGPRAAFLPSF